MSNQIFKIPLWNHWNGKYTPKSPKLPKYPKNYKMSKKKTLWNLLIDQNSLKISKTTKTRKPLKWQKYPFGVTRMANILLKSPKYLQNHKMSKKNPSKSLNWPKLHQVFLFLIWWLILSFNNLNILCAWCKTV